MTQRVPDKPWTVVLRGVMDGREVDGVWQDYASRDEAEDEFRSLLDSNQHVTDGRKHSAFDPAGKYRLVLLGPDRARLPEVEAVTA